MQKRIQYMDSLRAIAILGVLLLHVATPYVVLYGKINEIDWQIGIIYNALSRWCVPIFFNDQWGTSAGQNGRTTRYLFQKNEPIKFYCRLLLGQLSITHGQHICGAWLFMERIFLLCFF